MKHSALFTEHELNIEMMEAEAWADETFAEFQSELVMDRPIQGEVDADGNDRSQPLQYGA